MHSPPAQRSRLSVRPSAPQRLRPATVGKEDGAAARSLPVASIDGPSPAKKLRRRLVAAFLALLAGWFAAGSLGLFASPAEPHPPAQASSSVKAPAETSSGIGRRAGPAEDSFVSRGLRVLRLQDYNTRVVLLGTTLLGAAGGAVGVFMLLRKRSLAGDVVGHAALPGVAVAFLILERLYPGSEKPVSLLLVGALVTGYIGILTASLIDRWTRIAEEAALAIVLSLFFGLGVTLFSLIQQIPGARAAGLESLIFGKASLLVASDVWEIAAAAVVVLLATLAASKELALLCFDSDFAAAQGWPVGWLDTLLMGLVAGTTVIGLQSVGLLLVVALMVIPPSAARFWTDRLERMLTISIAVGAASGGLGTVLSALFPKLAAGATIVLVGAAFFGFSLVFGRKRGIYWRRRQRLALRRRVQTQQLLDFVCEATPAGGPTQWTAVRRRSTAWTPAEAERLADDASRAGWLVYEGATIEATAAGRAQSRRHRELEDLWRLYLRLDPEGAPSRLGEDLDGASEALEPALREELLARLRAAPSDPSAGVLPLGEWPAEPVQPAVAGGEGVR